MSIEAVTLDIYGTLLDLSPIFLPATEKILMEERIEADAAKFSGLVSREILLRLNRYEIDPSAEYQTIREIWAEAFGSVFDKYGVDGNIERGVDIWFELLHSISPFPEVPEAVGEIAARYKVAIVSDADDEMLMPAWEKADLPVKHIFTSEAAQAYKIQPASKIFCMAFETLQVEPHQAVHVGDARADVIGAINAGARVIWLSRDGRPWEDGEFTPTAIARDFNDVISLLGEI